MTKTRSQRYSTNALQLIRQFQTYEEADLKKGLGETRRWLDGLPGLVLVNGLIPVLLRLQQQSTKDEVDEVAKNLLIDLEKQGFEATALTAIDSVGYMRSQRQALEYLAWVKRWGQALLKTKEGNA